MKEFWGLERLEWQVWDFRLNSLTVLPVQERRLSVNNEGERARLLLLPCWKSVPLQFLYQSAPGSCRYYLLQ